MHRNNIIKIVPLPLLIISIYFTLLRSIMTRSLLTVAVAAAAVTAANAFAPAMPSTIRTSVPSCQMAVLDVDSEAEFDNKISGAGDSLVIIDYSTTWCGPCKVIAPKFDELSDAYPDSVFIKVRTIPGLNASS